MPPRRRRMRLTPGHWRLPVALQRWTVFGLRRAAGALTYESERVLAASGLSLHEFAALAVLVERTGMPQTALGERIGLDRNGTSRLLDGLEEEGLIVRRAHLTDARRRVVEVTTAGRSQMSAGEKDLAAIEAVFLSVLDAAERDELRHLLRPLEPPPPMLGDLYAIRPPSASEYEGDD
jgi:DNA-binding MarR family transcriptional regulator